MANRGRREIEPLIGFFVNTLALRVDLAGEPTVAELLAACARSRAGRAGPPGPAVRAGGGDPPAAARAWPHARVPGDVRLAEHSAAGRPRASPGCTLQPLRPRTAHGVKFDLTSAWRETRRAASSAASSTPPPCSTPPPSSATRGYLQRLLRGDGRRRPAAVRCSSTLLDADERQLLLEAWNDTATRLSARARASHQLFEAQAARDPDAVALVFEDEQLSYGELNARANRLAHHLIGARASGPTSASRSASSAAIEMVVGPPRHPQGRRRLRAARSGYPRRAPRVHARRQRARRVLLTARRARARGRDAGAAGPARRARPRRPTPAAGPGARNGQPRSRDPRPDRRATSPTSSTPPAPPAAQGRDGRASRRGQPDLLVQRATAFGLDRAIGAADRLDRLRRLRLGVLLAAAARRAASGAAHAPTATRPRRRSRS